MAKKDITPKSKWNFSLMGLSGYKINLIAFTIKCTKPDSMK